MSKGGWADVELPVEKRILSLNPCRPEQVAPWLDQECTVEEGLLALDPRDLGWLVHSTMGPRNQAVLERLVRKWRKRPRGYCCITCELVVAPEALRRQFVRKMLERYELSPQTRCNELY